MKKQQSQGLSKSSWFCLVIFSLVLWNCGLENGDGGAVSIAVSKGSLSASSITKVTVSVLGKDMPTMNKELNNNQGKWKGRIGNISPGTDRSFRAIAYDSGNKALFEGSASNVQIAAGKTTSVLITLQQNEKVDPFMNHPPIVEALSAYPVTVELNEPISLKVKAYDNDKGDNITISWISSGGSFGDSSSAETTWSAPNEGDYKITLTISDKHGSSIVASTTLSVRGSQVGIAAVQADFNMWPVVTEVTTTLGRININEFTSLNVFASDSDGDNLRYEWTDEGGECAGSFSDPTAKAPVWKAPSKMPATGQCSITVTAKDGRGGLHKGHIVVQMGPAFKFKKTKPVLDTTAPTTAPGLPSGSTLSVFHSLHLTCKDSGSGCKRIVYTLDGTKPSFNPANGTIVQGDKATVSSFPFEPLVNVKVRFASEDNAGNIETPKEANYVTGF